MSNEDFDEAKSLIKRILSSDKEFEQKLWLVAQLQMLDLTENECMKLYEYIDDSNTEVNMLCFRCRDACRRSEVR